MTRSFAIISAGAMGCAVGARLYDNGARVLTTIDGRSSATVARAAKAGMIGASDRELVACDIVLSIVPPDQAEAVARRVVEASEIHGSTCTYADLNAISPETVARIGDVIGSAGLAFVDGSIIGGPPGASAREPTIYISGAGQDVCGNMAALGLQMRHLDGGVGAASSLKMCYAGITKGTTALTAAMILAACRAGVADSLRLELGDSQAAMLSRIKATLPGMLPKAFRWAPEMHEIAAFIGEGRPESALYDAMGQFYAALAAGTEDSRAEVANLVKFIGLEL